MSHTTLVQANITDIESVQEACKELGFTIRKGGTVKSYYNDKTADYVISISGCPYEVGLVWNNKEKKYDLLYDSYGGHIESRLGKNCGKLVQSAAFHKVAKAAKLKGFFVAKKIEGNKIQCIITAR
jgi:hypothetical protein